MKGIDHLSMVLASKSRMSKTYPSGAMRHAVKRRSIAGTSGVPLNDMCSCLAGGSLIAFSLRGPLATGHGIEFELEEEVVTADVCAHDRSRQRRDAPASAVIIKERRIVRVLEVRDGSRRGRPVQP